MRIHHVAFRTGDLPRLARFYEEVVGLTITRRDADRSVWLDAGGAILMLEARAEGEPDLPDGSRELLAFEVAAGTFAACVERLGDTPIHDRTAFTVYFRDPDGRRLALSSYPEPLGG
jgi:catechol 2,3-dioxygenase-like lactoylglutathione lyase family enzyme